MRRGLFEIKRSEDDDIYYRSMCGCLDFEDCIKRALVFKDGKFIGYLAPNTKDILDGTGEKINLNDPNTRVYYEYISKDKV